MKKKFKILACSLLLVFIVPCMFMLTGCGSSYTNISSKEYAKLVLDSGAKYYEKYNSYAEFGNMTVSTTYTSNQEDTVPVEYKENATDTEYVTEEFPHKTEGTAQEIVTVYNVGEGDDADICLQVTTTEQYVETGYRAADDTEALEAYTETSYYSTTYTFVKDDKEYKYYVISTEKFNDEEETVEKTYYTYASRDDYMTAISKLLGNINSNVMEFGFYPSEEMTELYTMLGLVPTAYYQDGNKFGYVMESAARTMFDEEYEGSYQYMKMDSTFANNMPNQVQVTMEVIEGNGMLSGTTTSKSNISYTANAVSKPADTTGYELTTQIPNVYIMGTIFGS